MSNLKINGNLTITGGEFLTADLIAEQGTNFIRYQNGLQITWGKINSSSISIKPFIDTNYIVVFAYEDTTSTGGLSARSIASNDKTTSSFYSYHSGSNRCYIAIGRWK